MPITGITDGNVGLREGMPQLGKLFKGEPKPEDKNQKWHPKDLDYFRLEMNEEYEDLVPIFEEMYGTEPTEFSPVLLLGQDVDTAFASWMEEYNASGTLLKRCDREQQVLYYDVNREQHISDRNIPCEQRYEGKTDHTCDCKQIGRLNIALPAFTDNTGVLGYFTIATHSMHDIILLYKRLQGLYNMTGNLLGVPFRVGRSNRDITRPSGKGDGKRAKMTKSLLYIETVPEYNINVLMPFMRGELEAPDAPQIAAPSENKIDLVQLGDSLGNGGNRRLDTSTGEIVDNDVVWWQDNEKREAFMQDVSNVTGKPFAESIADWQSAGLISGGSHFHNYEMMSDVLAETRRLHKTLDDLKTEQLRKTQESMDELAKGKKMPT